MSRRSGSGTEQPRSVQDRGHRSCHKKAMSGLDRGSGAGIVQAEETACARTRGKGADGLKVETYGARSERVKTRLEAL